MTFKDKQYYFGIALGYQSNNFKVHPHPRIYESDSFQVVMSPRSGGFNAGIISNFKVGEDLDLRLVPTFTFTDRKLEYVRLDGSIKEDQLQTVYAELPFYIRYKSKPYRDIKAYALLGVKYGFDLSAKARTRKLENFITLNDSHLAMEYGGGLQFYMPYFIFSPEIRISHSLSNALSFDANKPHSNIIDKLLLRSIIIVFNFEG